MTVSPLRYTGFSGVDTQSMINQLVFAKSAKYNKLQKENLLTSYKQEAYRNVATMLKTFQNSFLNLTSNLASSMRLSSNFNTMQTEVKYKDAISSDISIKTDSNIAAGKYKFTVNQVAKKDEYNGSVFKPSLQGIKEASPLTIKEGDFFQLSLDNEKTKNIIFNKSDVDKLQQGTSLDEVLNTKLKDSFGTDVLNSNEQKITAKIDEEGKLSFNALNGHSVKVNIYDEAMSDKLGGVKNNDQTKFDTSRKLEDVFNSEIFDNTGNISFSINNKDFTFNKTDSLETVLKSINESDIGVKMSYDSNKSKFVLNSEGTGVANTIKFEDKFNSSFLTDGLGFSESSRISKAQDAIVTINGVQTTRETNNFSINGFNVSLTENSVSKAEDGTVIPKEYTINVNKDTTKVKENIVKFVDEYNKLIGSLNSELNSPRLKSNGSYFMPLLTDEAANMKDTEITEWNKSVKTGLLYRDSILSNLTSDLRKWMGSSVETSGGNNISLSNIGITFTSKLGEGGKLVIDEDKLNKALETYGDEVSELFTKPSDISVLNKTQKTQRLASEGLADRLNDIINGAIDRNGTIYNKAGLVGTGSESNNDLYRQMKIKNDQIDQEYERIRVYEQRQYEMFSSMESAIMKMNSQMGSLQSMMGV